MANVKEQVTNIADHGPLARRLRQIEHGYFNSFAIANPRFVEDVNDWTRRGRALQARAVRDAFADAGHGLAALGQRALCAWRTWRAARDVQRTLGSLDERLLRDIGIERNDIPLVAAGLRPGCAGETPRVHPAAELLRLHQPTQAPAQRKAA